MVMPDGYVRVSFDIPEETAVELTKLQTQLGLKTRKELFDNAITLLQWAANKSSSKLAIASVDDNNQTFTELDMPCLKYAFRNSK